MAIVLHTPRVDELREVIDTLRKWQHDTAPFQLHPGDLGWFWRFGESATAAALRIWKRDEWIVAVGLLDGQTLLRTTTAPDALRDGELARQVVADLTRPERGVLPAGAVAVEAPTGALVHDLLDEAGWAIGEAWTPLCRDLARPVDPPALRIEIAGPDLARTWTTVERASFNVPPIPDDRWLAMAAGLPFAQARCLLGYDDRGAAVAAAAVWSAGPGRPGLLEPLGVHPDHRGRGHGTAITLACATALREMGSSSAIVCTPVSNAAATTTYRAAGFQALPDRHDRCRRG